MNLYETPSLLHQYLHFHFGKIEEIFPWPDPPREAFHYPQRCISECFPIPDRGKVSRGLDIGCATGRSSFEMALHCEEVIGIDYSETFIEAAEVIRKDGSHPYTHQVEGQRIISSVAERPPGFDPAKVSFEVGDAHQLRADLGSFDWVLAANLLCRLHHPRLFLEQLPKLLEPGGILVINSPFSWLEEFTSPEEFIGATPESGPSAEVLKDLLSPDFELVSEKNMPFLIPETGRKYQYTVAHSACWKRRS
ncbi:MAG: putative 4-mercaptohistidine N1-methyltransferase [Puniceicoccaceae bacterium]